MRASINASVAEIASHMLCIVERGREASFAVVMREGSKARP